MKRDFDLIRLILLDVESLAPGDQASQYSYLNTDQDVVDEHIAMIIDCGLVEGAIFAPLSGPRKGIPTRLTWEGHDFLNLAKDATLWSKAKKTIFIPGAAITLDLLKEWLKAEAKSRLGLP